MVDFPASHFYQTAGHVRQKSETSRNPAALKQQSPSNWGFPKKRDAPVSIHIKTCPSAELGSPLTSESLVTKLPHSLPSTSINQSQMPKNNCSPRTHSFAVVFDLRISRPGVLRSPGFTAKPDSITS